MARNYKKYKEFWENNYTFCNDQSGCVHNFIIPIKINRHLAVVCVSIDLLIMDKSIRFYDFFGTTANVAHCTYLVPAHHLLRKIDAAVDFGKIYQYGRAIHL